MSSLARFSACAVMLLAAVLAYAAGEARFADEDHDWGVAPTIQLRQPPYHSPTPREIPGAKVVYTRELEGMLNGPNRPLLIDVLSDEGHETLAGTIWLGGAGRGENFNDAVQRNLTPLLSRLTVGDKAKPLVFFCAGPQCWLSYNAALRAVAAGYTNVYWYRGGIDAWTDAELPTATIVGAR